MHRIWKCSRFLGRAGLCVALCCLLAVGQFWAPPASAEDSESARNPDADSEVNLAWSWVQSMLRTPTRVESTTILTPDREYPADWTGQVSGTFAVDGVAPPPVVPAAVALDPESAARAGVSTFRGVVTGRVTLPPQQNRWIIQAYRELDGQRSQVPAQSLGRPDGTFDIDVSAVEPGAGKWQFGVLDALNGYAPVGVPWPSTGTYSGWEIRSFATTDRRYLIGTQPASADGSFSFDNSAPGTKTYQLVALGSAGNASAEEVLAEHAPATGLVRSFGSQPGPGVVDDSATVNSYSYDQALALQAALVMGDSPTALTLLHGLIALQTKSGPQAGGFISTAPQSNPAAGAPIYRTGNTAIALYSILSYLHGSQGSDPDAPVVQRAAEQAADWLMRQQLPTGPMARLLTGGWGQVGSSSSTADPLERLPFASTEHNLDAWQALSLASQVLDCQRCAAAADSLQNAIVNVLWDPSGTGFSQGMRPEGRDTVDPLDINSWGSIFLDAIGQTELATASLGHTSAFRISDSPITGYLAFRPQPAIPDPVPSVWVEGSFGVAFAQARHGDLLGYNQTLAGLRAAQRPDGSFPVATSADSGRDLTTADRRFTVRTVACFGQCALAPVVEVNHHILSHVNERTLQREIKALGPKAFSGMP